MAEVRIGGGDSTEGDIEEGREERGEKMGEGGVGGGEGVEGGGRGVGGRRAGTGWTSATVKTV